MAETKPNKKCEIGDEVRVKFLDHGEGDQIEPFYVRGRVVIKTRRELVLQTWGPLNLDDDDAEGHNSHTFAIVRSAILQIDVWEHNESTRRKTRKSGNPSKKLQTLQVGTADAEGLRVPVQPADSPRISESGPPDVVPPI